MNKEIIKEKAEAIQKEEDLEKIKVLADEIIAEVDKEEPDEEGGEEGEGGK